MQVCRQDPISKLCWDSGDRPQTLSGGGQGQGWALDPWPRLGSKVVGYALMVQDAAGRTPLKLLHVQYGGKVLLALLRLLQVRWQVAVQEADHVAEDGETNTHPTLVALHREDPMTPWEASPLPPPLGPHSPSSLPALSLCSLSGCPAGRGGGSTWQIPVGSHLASALC